MERGVAREIESARGREGESEQEPTGCDGMAGGLKVLGWWQSGVRREREEGCQAVRRFTLTNPRFARLFSAA